jgi:uncharacterized protein YdaU (DUF1376 family)
MPDSNILKVFFEEQHRKWKKRVIDIYVSITVEKKAKQPPEGAPPKEQGKASKPAPPKD